MKLPPEGMDGRTADMFVDARKQQLSLQGALQHYLDKCWEGRVLSRGQSSHVQTVPHPWPGYIEESAPLSHEPLPGHLLRMLVYRGPRKPCARMSPTVRKRLGWTKEDKPPRAPGAGILRPLSAASGSSGNLQKDWDGWAVDVRLELANLVFPTGLSGDASIVRLLETDANSAMGLDCELSWHLHEILERLAVLGETGARSGKLAERLRKEKKNSGYLLPLHKRQLLAHQFAFQLEMSGDWQAAAYVLLSSAPSNVEDGIMDTGDDAIACQDAARALQALLARHGMDDAMKPSQAEPFILVANVHRLTVDIIAERLRVSRENVLIWFRQAQAWANRTTILGSPTLASQPARLEGNKELELCLSSCDWLRANHLLLSLISPADLPDPSGELRPQYTMQLLRKVDAGMSSFRRSKEWNLYRSLDTWSQGCGAILALVEIYETVARDDRDLERRKANSLLWKVKDAGNVIRALPLRTQRAIDNLYEKVAQGLWLSTQVPDDPSAAEMEDVVYLNELAIEPSAQLKLLHKFAVSRLHPAIVQDSLGGVHPEDDMLWETETEMC